MAHRTFHDDSGRVWEVWDVIPTTVERRVAKTTAAAATTALERRRGESLRVMVPEKLQKGWLAFQSGRERLRLSPIPPAWEDMNEPELADLLARAEHRSRARRLIE